MTKKINPEARRRGLVVSAATYVLANRDQTVPQAVNNYMQAQGLRRATWGAMDDAERQRFVKSVESALQTFNKQTV